MLVKSMKGERSELFPCNRIATTTYEDGIKVEVSPGGIVINLPADADALYVMNEKGDTIDSYRWPPKSKKVTE